MKKKFLCAAALFLCLSMLLCGCNRTSAEKASRSYNIVVNVVNETNVTVYAMEAEIRYNGINSGNRILGRSDKKSLEYGESVNFIYEQEDLSLGTTFDLKFFTIGANKTGTACGGTVSLEADYGEVYYVRITGDSLADLMAEQYFPED